MSAHSPMSNACRSRYYKIVVSFERRPDGGLRAWSDDVPGLVLSHKSVDALLADIKPALEFILSVRLGCAVTAEPLDHLKSELQDQGLVDLHGPQAFAASKEYVALPS